MQTTAVASSNAETRPSPRSIPSLDGMRAFAVGAVILSHFTGWSALPGPRWVRSGMLAVGQGGLGVSAFFIISGFLITTLLLDEQERTGTLQLKRFYFRRTLRIFPAFYVYLLVAALVARFAGHAIPTAALVTSAAYLSDYWPYFWLFPVLPAWYVAHTWSLAVEEQFYLIWPFLLVKLKQRRAIFTCLAVVCATPLLRIATVLWMPVYAGVDQWYRLFHTNADTLATGCLMAFTMRRPEVLQHVKRWLHPVILCVCAVFLVACASLMNHAPQWAVASLVIPAANCCLALLILFLVLHPQSPPGRVLNWGPIRHLGVISYSLYLWQQLFLGPYDKSWPLGRLLAVLVCAELSFWLVETPFLKLRGRLEPRWFARTPQVPDQEDLLGYRR